jgi:hypothetical protein
MINGAFQLEQRKKEKWKGSAEINGPPARRVRDIFPRESGHCVTHQTIISECKVNAITFDCYATKGRQHTTTATQRQKDEEEEEARYLI